MADRRDFIKSSLVLAAGMVVAGPFRGAALASALPPGLIYTSDNPGMWAKKVKSHAPRIKVEGRKVTITTKHGMSSKHFIVRHTLVSADGRVIGAKTFHPSDKEAVSTYDISGEHGQSFFATSFCNKHDFWVVEFTLKAG